MTGIDAKVTEASGLEEVIDAAQHALSDVLASPDDVADPVLYRHEPPGSSAWPRSWCVQQ